MAADADPPAEPPTEAPAGPTEPTVETVDRPADLRVALALLGISTALGVLLGLAWWWLAPRPQYLVADAGAVALVPATEGAFIAADGVFALGGLCVGAVVGAIAAVRRTRDGVGVMIGVAFGGLLGSGVAWAVGTTLGRVDLSAAASAAGTGAVVTGGLRVGAPGVLLTWTIAGLIAALAVSVARIGGHQGDADAGRDGDAGEAVASEDDAVAPEDDAAETGGAGQTPPTPSG